MSKTPTQEQLINEAQILLNSVATYLFENNIKIKASYHCDYHTITNYVEKKRKPFTFEVDKRKKRKNV